MTGFIEDLKILLGKSVYTYLIIPVPSIRYYREHLQNIIDSLEECEDIEVELGERDEGYIELKVAVITGKDYTTDWDVLLERINECNTLKMENMQLKKWNRCLAEKRHTELINPCGGWK